jgi:hypothetical protein
LNRKNVCGFKNVKRYSPHKYTTIIIWSENEGENEPKTSVLPLKALENGRLLNLLKRINT